MNKFHKALYRELEGNNTAGLGTLCLKKDNFAQNFKSCYEPVKFTCHIGNVFAAVNSSTNIFGVE